MPYTEGGRFALLPVKTMQENPKKIAEIMVVHRFVYQRAQTNSKVAVRNTETGKHFVLLRAKEQASTNQTVLIATVTVFVDIRVHMLEK